MSLSWTNGQTGLVMSVIVIQRKNAGNSSELQCDLLRLDCVSISVKPHTSIKSTSSLNSSRLFI